jgi:signal transduction histidine kinase
MSHLLADPTAVLVVGGSETEQSRVRRALADGVASAVLTAPTVESAGSVLASRDDVGSVVLPSLSGSDPVEWFEDAAAAAREHSDELPVVVLTDDDGVSAAAATRSDCRSLPASVTDEQLRATVANALATFDRRRREAAESSIFRTLLSESEVPLYAKDEEGRHLYKSDISDDMQDPAEIIGKTDLDAAEEEFLDAARDTYADDMQVVETGEGIYELEERAGRGDEEYWSLTTKVPWREDGEIQGLVGFSFDVTRWKERERRVAAERRRIERFTRYLAHDLRTPIQVAYGALDAAREGDEAAFEKVEQAHERMQTIVEDLRGLSTMPERSGGGYDAVSVGIASTHVVPLVEDIWESVDGGEGSLTVELPADALVVVRVGVVRPVLKTLLRNAVDHAGPDVSVVVGETDDNGIYVADDGPGFPPSVVEALSGDSIDRDDALGTGLLAVLDTVDQQGWRLSVGESEAGGARVEIGNCRLVTKTLSDAVCAESLALSAGADVGDVSVPGNATYDSETDTWRVTGSGRNVWGGTHEFFVRYATATEPVRLQGRVVGLEAPHEFSKAGLTIRAGTDERAPFGYVGTTGDHGSETTWRFARDGHTDSQQFEERADAFSWYRIEYGSGTLTCYLSTDGEDWRPVDQRSLDLGERVTLGLLVCSHSAEEVAEARFRSVTACRLDT